MLRDKRNLGPYSDNRHHPHLVVGKGTVAQGFVFLDTISLCVSERGVLLRTEVNQVMYDEEKNPVRMSLLRVSESRCVVLKESTSRSNLLYVV